MKNLSIKLIALTLTFVLFSNSSFTAILNMESERNLCYAKNNKNYFEFQSQEERKLKIYVEDDKPSIVSTIKFEVVSTVEPESFGIFNLIEGDSLVLTVNNADLTFIIMENNNDAELYYYYYN